MTNQDIRKCTCVVTGVAGFVGSHLAERLLSMGCLVVGIDDFSSGHEKNLAGFCDHPAFRFHEACITRPRLLHRVLPDRTTPRVLFHLAAIVSVPYSLEHPEETFRVNHAGTLSLLDQAVSLGFQRVVFAGSAAEYGDDERLPLREEYSGDETRQLSPYGRSKYLASKAVAGCNGVTTGVALRCFNIYGPRQDPNSPYSGVISRFVEKAVAGKPLTVFGDGGQTRDFVYVDDVVQAYLAASGLSGTAGRSPGGIFNVGSGTRTPIRELASMVLRLMGMKENVVYGPERPGDIRHSVASTAAIKKATGWEAAVPLEQGLRITLEWMHGERAAISAQKKDAPP